MHSLAIPFSPEYFALSVAVLILVAFAYFAIRGVFVFRK